MACSAGGSAAAGMSVCGSYALEIALWEGCWSRFLSLATKAVRSVDSSNLLVY
jgi:hypothetical protein